MTIFLDTFFTLIGIIFGSFIAALTYRYPKKISNLKGRSFCDNCKKQIGWFDNIPLLSFLMLKGKCRYCKKAISWRYPAIELTTGVGFFLIRGQPVSLIIFCILEIIFIMDFENQIIPDTFVFLGIFVVLLMTNDYLLFSNIFSGFLAASLLLLIHLITRGRGMGLGDVKFAVLGGLLVGLPLMMPWLFLAFLTGGIIGIILILGRRAGLKDKIAFGPFLVVSIGLTYLYGNTLLNIIFR